MRCALLQLLLASAWLGAAGPRGLAAQPVPLGPEVRVDTLLGDQYPNAPVLAVQPGGDFEIAWDYQGRIPLEIDSRHFAADGEPTDASQVLIASLGNSATIAATATPRGFDVLWVKTHGPFQTFYRNHLNLHGLPDPGKPVPLGGAGADWVWNVRGNGFMAGWVRTGVPGIAARRLTSSGQMTGPVLPLSSRPLEVGPLDPVIVFAVADGGFVAVWEGGVQGSAGRVVVRARRFSPAGKPLGPDFDINTFTAGTGPPPSDFTVAADPSGGFAVAWILSNTLYVRFFDASAKPLGPAVAAGTLENALSPESMAFDRAGNLLVLCLVSDDSVPPQTNLQIQLLDPHGLPMGPPESVGSAASSHYPQPFQGSVAWAGDSWLITWAARDPQNVTSAIFVGRFAPR